MSATPYLLPRARFGMRMGHGEIVDAMYRDGFLCPLCGQLMGETAENLVREFGISRAEQDVFAVESQRRARSAIDAGRFDEEIVPVVVPSKNGPVEVRRDEHPRGDTTIESLAKLPPVFDAENGDRPRRQLLRHHRRRGRARARVGKGGGPRGRRAARRGSSRGPRRASSPERMGIGPVPAIRALLAKTGRTLGRHRPDRVERGLRRAGHRLRASCRWTSRASTSTAARSRSATRSARREPASRRPSSTR